MTQSSGPRVVIEAQHLSKRYGDVDAVCDLSFSVNEGQIVGLLGPNGAGKTTTINMLTTLIPIDDGEASVAGFDVSHEAAMVRRVIGLAGQAAAHVRNRKKVMLIAAVVLALCCVGVGALAVRNHAARRAEAAYAAQPEWIKLRDAYLASAGDDRNGDKDLRLSVVHAMLDAGVVEERAEEGGGPVLVARWVGGVDLQVVLQPDHRTTGGDGGGARSKAHV